MKISKRERKFSSNINLFFTYKNRNSNFQKWKSFQFSLTIGDNSELARKKRRNSMEESIEVFEAFGEMKDASINESDFTLIKHENNRKILFLLINS